MTESQKLLIEYAENGSEDAFRALVHRYINLVFSTAIRLLHGDSAAAQDVSQIVFLHLSRNAKILITEPFLGGWLHRDTCYVASKTLLKERRRKSRERHASFLNSDNDHTAANIANIAPLLDESVNMLNDGDRSAILLRFFEQLDFQSMGKVLGSSEDAARMRVNRALDKLHSVLQRKGVSLGAFTLGTVLASQAVSAAPAVMEATISSMALTASTNLTVPLKLLKVMTFSKIKICIVASLIVASLVLPLLIRRAEHSKYLQAMTEAHLKNHALELENQRLSNLLTNLRPIPEDRLNELLQLRDEVGRFRLERVSGVDSKTLLQQIASLEAQLKTVKTNSIRGNFRPRTEWSDKGNETPFSAVETMLWASASRANNRLASVATSEAIAEKRWSLFPSEQLPIESIGGVNLIYTETNKQGDRAVVTAFVRKDFMAPPGGDAYYLDELRGWQLVKSDTGWKVSKTLLFMLDR